MLKFLKRIFSPSANKKLWTITEEMINQHEKVYINLCRYYNEDKSKSIEVNPQGLLKYRLLGASFPSSAYRFAFCKDKPELSSEVEEKALAMAKKPFSPNSQHPYLLDAILTVSTSDLIFPLAQRLITEDCNTPYKNVKLLYSMHYEAIYDSIRDKDYLDSKEAVILGSVTSPMAYVTQLLG
ncbi:MAG: hypothetical protein F2923_00265 [Actinobacteria bacterium]|nr:hypothetical protein [Actinomycetota bacterium]